MTKKIQLPERLAFIAGRLDGLAASTRYAVDIGMAGELEEIARELKQLSESAA